MATGPGPVRQAQVRVTCLGDTTAAPGAAPWGEAVTGACEAAHLARAGGFRARTARYFPRRAGHGYNLCVTPTSPGGAETPGTRRSRGEGGGVIAVCV